MINLACLSEKIHVQTSLLMPLLFIRVKKKNSSHNIGIYTLGIYLRIFVMSMVSLKWQGIVSTSSLSSKVGC